MHTAQTVTNRPFVIITVIFITGSLYIILHINNMYIYELETDPAAGHTHIHIQLQTRDNGG